MRALADTQVHQRRPAGCDVVPSPARHGIDVEVVLGNPRAVAYLGPHGGASALAAGIELGDVTSRGERRRGRRTDPGEGLARADRVLAHIHPGDLVAGAIAGACDWK